MPVDIKTKFERGRRGRNRKEPRWKGVAEKLYKKQEDKNGEILF